MELRLGKYKHFKGGEYEMIGVVKHSETGEGLVLYKALYGEREMWVRPLVLFLGTVEIKDYQVPRFEYVG